VVLQAEDIERMTYLPVASSPTSPIATPATGRLRGTPASIIARLPEHTEAMDEDPFDSVISDTTRMM